MAWISRPARNYEDVSALHAKRIACSVKMWVNLRFKAIVAPRLIGWVSTRAASGQLNLAPYSFFGAFSTFPSIIGFASEGRKDSIRNIEETREFVWNLATRPLAERMNRTSAPVAADVDEFQLSGLTPVAGRNVSVP